MIRHSLISKSKVLPKATCGRVYVPCMAGVHGGLPLAVCSHKVLRQGAGSLPAFIPLVHVARTEVSNLTMAALAVDGSAVFI